MCCVVVCSESGIVIIDKDRVSEYWKCWKSWKQLNNEFETNYWIVFSKIHKTFGKLFQQSLKAIKKPLLPTSSNFLTNYHQTIVSNTSINQYWSQIINDDKLYPDIWQSIHSGDGSVAQVFIKFIARTSASKTTESNDHWQYHHYVRPSTGRPATTRPSATFHGEVFRRRRPNSSDVIQRPNQP